MDALEENWIGFPEAKIGTSAQPFEGKGYMEVTSNGDIVYMKTTDSIDASKYAQGTLHLSVYVSESAVIKGGQIELTSSGIADADELNFGDFGANIKLNKGWNTITLPMSSGKEIGKPDLSNITYMRVYFNIEGGSATVGIDNFYLSLPNS